MFSLFCCEKNSSARRRPPGLALCCVPAVTPSHLDILQRMSLQKPWLRRAGGCAGACGRELVLLGPEAQPQVRVQGGWERGRGGRLAVLSPGVRVLAGLWAPEGTSGVWLRDPARSLWVDQGAFHCCSGMLIVPELLVTHFCLSSSGF